MILTWNQSPNWSDTPRRTLLWLYPKKTSKPNATVSAVATARNATKTKPNKLRQDDVYANLDSSVVAELRSEDAEIADLEAKLGLGNKRDKHRLHKEYAKLEGYGDDFGDFLDDLDTLVTRVVGGERYNEQGDDDSDDSDRYQNDEEDDDDDDDVSEPDEELVPMKGAPIYDEDDSIVDDEPDDEGDDIDGVDDGTNDDPHEDSDGESSQQEDEGDEKVDSDHDVADTYRPIHGEDILWAFHRRREISTHTNKVCSSPSP